MELQPVAVLGIEGWITTPTEKMDNLFMHFVESNYSQTVTCLGQVYSFQYILNQFRDNPNGLVNEIKTKMSLYFSGYFKKVDITVDTIIDPLKQDTLILRIFLEVEDEYGKVFNLAKVSSNINSKTIRWANMNNYGDPDFFNQ